MFPVVYCFQRAYKEVSYAQTLLHPHYLQWNHSLQLEQCLSMPQTPAELQHYYRQTFLRQPENFHTVSAFIGDIARHTARNLPPHFYQEAFTFLHAQLCRQLEKDKILITHPDDLLKYGFQALLRLATHNMRPEEAKLGFEKLMPYPKHLLTALDSCLQDFIQERDLSSFLFFENNILSLKLCQDLLKSAHNTGKNKILLCDTQKYLHVFLYSTTKYNASFSEIELNSWHSTLKKYTSLYNPNSFISLMDIVSRQQGTIHQKFFEKVLCETEDNFLPGLFDETLSFLSNKKPTDFLFLYECILKNFEILYKRHKSSIFEEATGCNLLTFMVLKSEASSENFFIQNFQIPFAQKLLDKGEEIIFPTPGNKSYQNLVDYLAVMGCIDMGTFSAQTPAGEPPCLRTYWQKKEKGFFTKNLEFMISTYREQQQLQLSVASPEVWRSSQRASFKV